MTRGEYRCSICRKKGHLSSKCPSHTMPNRKDRKVIIKKGMVPLNEVSTMKLFPKKDLEK
jgi:hypothetical protein